MIAKAVVIFDVNLNVNLRQSIVNDFLGSEAAMREFREIFFAPWHCNSKKMCTFAADLADATLKLTI